MKYLPLLLVLILFSSCENQREKEIGLIAEEIKKCLVAKDYTYLNDLVSYERMLEKAYVKLRVPYNTMKQSVERTKNRSSLSDYLTNKDYSTKLKVISHDDKKITLSIQHDSLIINYVDLIIKPIKDKLQITDFYLYQQGFSFSDEMQYFATVIKETPDQVNDFNLYLEQVRMINIALLNNDVLTAKYYFKLIKNEYRESKISESIHMTMSSYDINSNTDLILDKYIKEKPEQSKHGIYLKLMKYMYQYDCPNVEQQIKELWKYTGVDSIPLKYYEDCLLSQDYIIN